MKSILAVVGSVTYAMKGKDILFENGIRSYVERTKRTKEFGCGYGIRIYGSVQEGIELLKKNGIRLLAVIDDE